MLFGTPRRDAGEGEAKSPPPSKANGTETEGFPSPQAVMKEDMLKGMTPTEVGSQTYSQHRHRGASQAGRLSDVLREAGGGCAAIARR